MELKVELENVILHLLLINIWYVILITELVVNFLNNKKNT